MVNSSEKVRRFLIYGFEGWRSRIYSQLSKVFLDAQAFCFLN